MEQITDTRKVPASRSLGVVIDIDDALDFFAWARARVRAVMVTAVEFAISQEIDPETFEYKAVWKLLKEQAEQAAKDGKLSLTMLRCQDWEDRVRQDCRIWITEERRRIGRRSLTANSSAS